METITRIRGQLDELLAQLNADHQALRDRERDVAAQVERLNQQAAVQAAWRESGAAMKGRILALIDLQLEQLQRSGTNAIVLNALRKQVLEVEG